MKEGTLGITRWLVVLGILVAGVWAVRTIRLQTELFSILPRKLLTVQGLEIFQEKFALAQEVMVVIEPDGAGTNRASLAAQGMPMEKYVERLHKQLAATPCVESVIQPDQPDPQLMAKTVAWLIANLPPDRLAEFQQLFSESELRTRLQKTRSLLSGTLDEEELFRLRMDPLELSYWLEKRGGVRLPSFEKPPEFESGLKVLIVCAKDPLKTFYDCQGFVGAVRSVIQQVDLAGQSPSVKVFLTGRPAFVAEISAQMKRDIMVMLMVTTLLSAGAFWLFYRSLFPVIWILLLQGLALLTALIVARCVFTGLNVLSMGFAAILMGVGMDYCILVYHFFASSPASAENHDLPAVKESEVSYGVVSPKAKMARAQPELRSDHEWRFLKNGIWLSAITTAAAFSILAFSGFPGFKELTLLVGVGLLATAYFATDLEPIVLKRFRSPAPVWLGNASDGFTRLITRLRWWIRWGLIGGVALWIGLWPFWSHYHFYDSDLAKLRPTGTGAYQGLQDFLKASRSADPLAVIVRADNWDQLRSQVLKLEKGLSMKFSSTLCWIPQGDFLPVNRPHWQGGKNQIVQAAVQKAGFETNWSAFTCLVLDQLDQWKAGRESFSAVRFAASHSVNSDSTGQTRFALLRLPMPEGSTDQSIADFWNHHILSKDSSLLPANWLLLQMDLRRVAQSDFKRLSLWMLASVILLCWVAHRSIRLVLLNMFGLAVSLLALSALLYFTGSAMNVLSLLSIPLLIGLVIDYSLHILLAMERDKGNLKLMYRHMAVPVMLTGLTSIIGFGSPNLTNQPALQNFGNVMDLGIISAVLTGLTVLPVFYFRGNDGSGPSRYLYRAFWFEASAWFARFAGRAPSRAVGKAMGWFYGLTHPAVKRVVRKNLALLSSEPVAANTIEKLFTHYGATLADYFVLGVRPREERIALIKERKGIEYLKRAHEAGRGGLLVTSHLALFELGGVIMTELGYPITVLTRPEPSRALTQWRADFRKRWGADTLEIGNGEFAFVEALQHLREGRFVAVLIDRPQTEKRVQVDFPNGRVPFSTGFVLLALLAECPIIPVSVVERSSGGYRLEAHPLIEPKWLPGGRMETLEHFALEVAGVLKPIICQHPDQWYQFVPLST